MKVDAHHVIYKNPAWYCGPGPSVVCDPEGRLTVAFRRVRSWLRDGLAGHWHPSTETCLTHSDDLGQSWSPPRVILAGWQCPCLTRLRDGTLIHHSHRFELVSADIRSEVDDGPGRVTDPWPGIHAGTAIHRSTDGGLTWRDPAWLSGAPDVEAFHRSLHEPVAVRGNVLERRDGSLLVSAYGLEDRNTSFLFASVDDGRTWSYRSEIGRGFNETYLHETPSGLIALMRARGDRADRLHISRSEDGSRWSDPEPILRGYPGTCASFASGDLALVYGYRFEDGYGVRARTMTSDGTVRAGETVIRDDGAVPDLGYPDAVPLPDGRVFVVYYVNRILDADDRTAPRDIESCILSA